MLVDHIGVVFFPEIAIFRIIGRLSLPIFSFFLAEGYYYTKSRKKYFSLIVIFMFLSWVPHNVAFDLPMYKFNIFTNFALSMIGMFLIDKIRQNDNRKIIWISVFVMLMLICFILEGVGVNGYGLLVVLLPMVFYAYKQRIQLKFILAGIVLLLLAASNIYSGGVDNFASYYQCFGLLALPVFA